MIKKFIAARMYPAAVFVRRHRFLGAVALVLSLALFGYVVYRLVTTRSMPCFSGYCNRVPSFLDL